MATKILCAVDDSEHATVAIQAATTIAKAMGALSREMVMNLQSFETACVYGGLPSRAIAYRRRADRMTSIEVSDHLRLIAGRLPRRSNAKSHVGVEWESTSGLLYTPGWSLGCCTDFHSTDLPTGCLAR